MIRLLLFFKKIYVGLLFLLIEVVCLVLFFNHNPYQRARMLAVSNVVVGGVHSKIESVSGYFSLQERNEALLAENARLRGELSAFITDSVPSNNSLAQRYLVARVVHNSYTGRDNFITIDKGSKDGVVEDMALFNSDGIVGYVLACSQNYAVAMSVLNMSGFRSNGLIKGTNFTGSISWGGVSHRRLTFDDVPKYAKVSIGDTIETTAISRIFPSGIPIGTVKNFEIVNGTSYVMEIEMMADMSRLDYLYAVSLKGQKERKALEDSYLNQED